MLMTPLGKLTCVVGVAGAVLLIGCEPTNQGYKPQQPIDYSHAVHAGSMKIPCGYCHYDAETGRHAGIPPALLCMNCHEQVKKDHPEVLKIKTAIETNTPIEWVRVHRVPDHVYFNHSAHVNGGVECQSCHGPVEGMGRVSQWATMSMGWCVECHRANSEPGPNAAPGDVVRASPLTDCAVCHH